MAFQIGRLFTSKVSGAFKVANAAKPALIQVARISVTTQLPEKPKPFPYEKRGFNVLWSLVDTRTENRLDENSKIIIVEGGIGTGKHDFAMELAGRLDFMYFHGGLHDEYLYDTESQVDIRDLQYVNPNPNHHIYDYMKFYSDPDPSKHGKAALMQIQHYIAKYFSYIGALRHVLNTGQGVVMNSSIWNDLVYAQAMRDCNYISPKAFRYYKMVRDNTICELWKPHLTIFLDSTVDQVKENLVDRTEENSPVLTTKYLERLEHNYKNVFLPERRKDGEVLMYDSRNPEDWEIVLEDIEQLDLEPKEHDEEETRFKDWADHTDDSWIYHRIYFTNDHLHLRNFSFPFPDAPELFPTEEEQEAARKIN